MCSLPFVFFHELLEVLDAEGRKRGDEVIVVEITDVETAIFGLQLERDLLQPCFVLAAHFGHAADGEDVAWGSHLRLPRRPLGGASSSTAATRRAG